MKECTVGTGAACGAIYLDRGFENLIKKKFADVGAKTLDEKRLSGILRQFDHGIKRQFNPFDPMIENDFEFPVSGIHDIPQIGLLDGYMTITK